jgi:hypothetical protein
MKLAGWFLLFGGRNFELSSISPKLWRSRSYSLLLAFPPVIIHLPFERYALPQQSFCLTFVLRSDFLLAQAKSKVYTEPFLHLWATNGNQYHLPSKIVWPLPLHFLPIFCLKISSTQTDDQLHFHDIHRAKFDHSFQIDIWYQMRKRRQHQPPDPTSEGRTSIALFCYRRMFYISQEYENLWHGKEPQWAAHVLRGRSRSDHVLCFYSGRLANKYWKLSSRPDRGRWETLCRTQALLFVQR